MPKVNRYEGPVDEKIIGSRVRDIRRRRGLTQVDLARMLGVEQSLISHYERGAVRVHGSLVAKLASILKVSSDELLGLSPRSEEPALKDRRFLRRLQRIDKLSKRDKELLLGTVDAFLLKVS